jgi:hypothetical protein
VRLTTCLLALILAACSVSRLPEKDYARKLTEINRVWDLTRDMHPAWSQLQPVCVISGQRYCLFHPQEDGSWRPVRTGRLEMAVPVGIRAAFPLPFADGEMACVIDSTGLDSPREIAVVFHEFVHCFQFNTCEMTIKNQMEIGREGAASGNGMWELNYPFPYADSLVTRDYLSMIDAAERGDTLETRRLRGRIHDRVSARDWEYLTWQEFKEGSARWLENRLRAKLNLEPARSMRTPPMNRVTLYEGGDRLIRLLTASRPDLGNDFPALWAAIRDDH